MFTRPNLHAARGCTALPPPGKIIKRKGKLTACQPIRIENSEKSYDNTGYQKSPQSIQNDQFSLFQWQNLQLHAIKKVKCFSSDSS
jgi:hypothetical protein